MLADDRHLGVAEERRAACDQLVELSARPPAVRTPWPRESPSGRRQPERETQTGLPMRTPDSWTR